MTQPSPHRRGNGPLYLLALGTFAVGTESFMVAGLLQGMAADLAVSVATAGQLVSVFALAYALSSPILTALTGSFGRRVLLISAMAAFAVANILAWSAQDYWQLMAARVLLAFAAGLYVPGANALAAALVAPERRGTAIAIVNGGLSLAIAFGVPLGAIIGEHMGWRATFGAVALLAGVAAAGLFIGLPKYLGEGLSTASLRERAVTALNPAILLTLLVTTLWAMASYTTYTYLALFVSSTTTLHGAQIGYILCAWGVAAALGLAISGKAIDKLGAQAVIVPALMTSGASFLLLSGSTQFVSHSAEMFPVIVAVIAWGIAHWAFYPAQQTMLVATAGVKSAPIVLSLNASFMYLGFSLGAAFGSLTISYGKVSDLGYASALSMGAALTLALAKGRLVRSEKLLTAA